MIPTALLVIIAGILARMEGGGLGAARLAAYHITLPTVKVFGRPVGGWSISLKWLPAFLLAVPFGVTAGHAWGAGWDVLATASSYGWIQTGYGIVLPWGGALDPKDRTRTQFLSPVVDWLADRLGIVKTLPDGYSRTLAYCRLFMAVKGFLIGLPVGGVLLAVGWPLAYEIGAALRRAGVPVKTANGIAEALRGVFAALQILVTWKVIS